MSRALAVAVLVASALAGGSAVAVPATPGDDRPDASRDGTRDSGLTETAEAELAQFDFTVEGERAAVASLTADDLRVRVGFTRLTGFRLDRMCPDPSADDPTAAPVRARPTHILYFDQPLLTQAGRARALDLAREIAPALIARGGRVTVVSNAAEVATYVEDSTDPERVAAALDALEADERQWDPYASFESARIEEVLRDLNLFGGIEVAIQTARRHQRYERWIAEKNLRRLDHVLGRLAAADPPKAMLYFADTLRANAGEHYLSFFGDRTVRGSVPLTVMRTEAETARLAYDRVLEKAAALGVRFYTVYAQGLTVDTERSRLTRSYALEADIGRDLPKVRVRDAENALNGLAGETGGQAFLYAASGERIAERISDDLACVFVVSFDPAGFDRDQPLPLRVETRRDDVRLRARGQIVIQSDEARRETRLLAAFSVPDENGRALAVRDALVPIDYQDGAYRALLQLHVPAVPFTRATWDLGATLVSGANQVGDSVSARVVVPAPGAPTVLEREVRIPPGPVRVVSVAHETATDRIVSARSEDDWGSPDARPATLGPVAVLQPAAGVFVRDGETRPSGSLAVGPEGTVEAGLPTALVGLACRARRMKRPIRVERSVSGPVPLEFDATEFDADENRCVQIRDVVPEDTLRPGAYVYRVRVSVDGREFDSAERRFVVADGRADPAPHEPDRTDRDAARSGA